METIHRQHAKWSEETLDRAQATNDSDMERYYLSKAQTHALLAMYWLKASPKAIYTPPGTRDR